MIRTKKLFPTVGLLFVIGFSLFASAQPVQAACAPQNIIYVSPSGSNVGGCTWATAFTTLQSALAIAASGDQIWVAAGTYYADEGTGQTNNSRDSTFNLKQGVAIYGGFAGTETLLNQRNSNPATNGTILSGEIDGVAGNANNAYHIVSASSVTEATILDGFTLTGANTSGDGFFGGGGYVVNASPAFANLIITSNTSPTGGGGGMFIGTDPGETTSSPTLTNVTFSNNTAERGGGLFNQNSDPTLTNVIFTGNTATNGAGGGMNSQTANAGDPPSNPVLIDVTFSSNTATGGGGMINSNSHATFNRVTFSGNTASRRGGGLVNENSNPELTNVTFYGNISNESTGSTPWGGGGMFNATSNPILNNVTFSGNNSMNTSGTAGGDAIRNTTNSAPVIRNTIFWHDLNDEINGDGTGSLTISDSVVEGGCPSGGTCTNIINADPALSAPASNGGFTQTMAIGAAGSAVNAGNDATCASTDQRGVSRPQGPACDIGAYEYVDITPPTLVSFARQNPASSPTNADTLVFRASFNEPVTNVTIGDFLVNGLTSATVTNVNTVSTTLYDITVSGGNLPGLNGPVGVDLSGSQDIKDVSNNALPAGEPATDETYVVDNAAPTITINNPSTAPAQSKTLTAGTSDGTLTMSTTTGSICDGTLTFVAYASQIFTSESDNGKRVCYQAVDNAGNTAYSLSNAIAGIDITTPDTSITANPTNPSNSAAPSFSLSGSDPGGSGVGSFECKLDAGSFAACASPQNYSGLSSGSHTFQVRAIDNAGNTDPSPASFTWTIDLTPPAVLSVVRASSNPTTALSVDFTVTFSESVTDVDTLDFGLTTVGVTGASVSSVNGTGTTYTVTVITGADGGTIRLDVVDNDSIRDVANNPLGGTGTGNGNFTSGEEYTALAVMITGNTSSAGVKLSYTDGTQKTVTSQPNGSYSISISRGWSGTIVPSLAATLFSPPSRTYADLVSDQSAQDYTGTPIFTNTTKWTTAFDLSHGWTVSDYVRTVGDANGDGKADLVGFGLDGVYISISTGTNFPAPTKWTSSFDLSHGWTVSQYVRTVGDANGDGKADLVGFGLDGVYVGLSTGSSFNTPTKWTSFFDLSHGWTVSQYVRTVGDVNGDGKTDLVGFGLDGVYVGLSTGSSFNNPTKWTSAFDLSHGWTVSDFVRTVGDVNGDDKDDLIGFGLDGVYIALSNGSGFNAVSKWTSAFDLSHGWTVSQYVRTAGDINGDGRADVVGFGLDGVYIALSTGNGFTPASRWTNSFDLSHGWTVSDFVRTVGDVTGNGTADLVGFGLDGVYVSK